MICIGVHPLSDAALDRTAELLGLPRGWGTAHPETRRWYRRKRNRQHDLLQSGRFKRLISQIPIVISVSNHNGEIFTNFQIFAIADFDNEQHPDDAKIPLEIYCRTLEDLGIDEEHYLVSESGRKGYHAYVFFDEPIHATEVERFQEKVFGLCEINQSEEAHKWVHLPDGYDPETPLKEQNHTIVETLTALGDGNMLKALFSMHPKDHSRFELPYTLEKILSRSQGDPQTEEDFQEAEQLVLKVKKVSAIDILKIAEIDRPLKEPATTNQLLVNLKREPKVKFTIPPESPAMNLKVKEMLDRILAVPCLTKSFDVSISQDGVYWLRANIVTALANMGYTRAEIGYLFREIINDEADNANKGVLEGQVDYWYGKKYHCRCDYFQETASSKFCCNVPCGRRSPQQPEPEPTHLHLTRVKEFEPIYEICEKIIDSKKPLVVCPKTTRAGFTTALNIVAREKGKKILFLVPRTSISEKTFSDTICLASEKKGVVINGFVLSANQKACLIRMKEAIEYEKEHGKPMNIEIPIPREDCKKCPYRGTIVTPPPNTPLFESDAEHDKCMLETYRKDRELFDSGFTTYAKIYAILNTPSEDAKEMLQDVEKYDIIVFDEITQFVEVSPLQIQVVIKWREYDTPEKPPYNFFAGLNKDLEEFQKHVGLPETEEKIHGYVNTFIEHFANPDKYKHTTKEDEKILSPLTTAQRGELSLNMITYLNYLYNYHLSTDKSVKTLYDALSIMCEEFWYAQKLSTMEHTSEINFLVPPKNKEVVNWVKKLGAQIVITDAVLPYQDLKDVFGPELEEVLIGDPQGTAKTQLVIPDTRSISPTRLFDDTPRLIEYIKAIEELHGVDNFLVACSNSITAETFTEMFPEIPSENVTWYRSNMTIGVPCNHRVMVTLSTPYTPEKAFDWAAVDIKGNADESNRFWKLNARNTFFQTIGRVKDPLANKLSVVYTYGVRRAEVENLLKGCYGMPRVVELPVMREISNAHTMVGDYWLHNGDCALSPNEIKILTMHNRGDDIEKITRDVGVSSSFAKAAIERLTEAEK